MEKKSTKLFFTTLALILINVISTFGQSGIFESYIVLNLNGGGNSFYDMQASTGNPDFQGASLGTFACNGSLVIAGGENKTFKCNPCDILNGTLNYRVWSGSPSGAFTGINLPFNANLGTGCNGNDQKWQQTGNATNIISGLAPGNYTLEVYSTADYNGCGTGTHFSSNGGANYSATFVVGPAPSAAITPSSGTLTCTTTSISLVASGGGTYLWEDNSTNATRSVSAAGTYTVTVTDATNGCTASAQAVIGSNTMPPAVSASASPSSICAGNSSTLTGSGATTYSWMPGSLTGTTVSVSPASTTTYTVTGTDASNGCTATATTTVTVLPNPIIITSMKSNAALFGGVGTAGVTTQPAGCTYLWSPGGQTTNYIQNQTPGTYNVTITAPGGCTKVQTLTIN